MKNKEILLITQYFVPDITAAAYRLDDLYKALEEKGFDVTIVTTFPQKTSIEEIKHVPNIHRLKVKKVQKRNFLGYIVNYFGFMLTSLLYTLFKLRKHKFEYIIVSSPPLFVGLTGVILSKLKRSQLIIDIRDIWPDSAVAAGMLKPQSVLYKFSKVVEKIIYKSANMITCVSKPMKEYISKESNHQHIKVLYNGITEKPTDAYQNESEESKSNHISNHNRVKVVYTGNIGTVQGLDLIIEANNKLKNQGLEDQFEFILVGDGAEKNLLESKAIHFNNVTFTGAKTKNETLNVMNNDADALFLNLSSHPALEKTIPSKLFDYLLVNKPILSGLTGESKTILDSLGCSITFDPTNADSLVRALSKFKESRKELEMAAVGNRSFVLEHFNRTKAFKKFAEELKLGRKEGSI